MNKGNLNNNTNTRRKGSMLKDSLSKIMYLFVLAFLLVIPMKAKAGFYPAGETDTGADRLIYYYDEVGRHTLIQVTNTDLSGSTVDIHVQIFQATSSCSECDFDDSLTPGQTTVYDIEKLPCVESNTYGFVAISEISGPADPLIGMFRVLDKAGFEYRTNAVNAEDSRAGDVLYNMLNFNNVTRNKLSDVIGITYASLSRSQVYASDSFGFTFGSLTGTENFIQDDNENSFSCSPVTFVCDNGTETTNFMSYGIDLSIPNSHGNKAICDTSLLSATINAGWLFLNDFSGGFFCNDPAVCKVVQTIFENTIITTVSPKFDSFFVGFLGLNNGNGTGSMDSWVSDASDNEVPGE